MTFAAAAREKLMDTMVAVTKTGQPVSMTYSGPALVKGMEAKKVVKVIRAFDRLTAELNKELNPSGTKISVWVLGIENAGESYSIRFEIRSP